MLVYILDTSMRLLHPYMPYVTEQLWHHLPRAPRADGAAAHALMLADWPQMDDAPLVKDAVAAFEVFQAFTHSIRNARVEYTVEQGKNISATIVAPGELKEATEAELKSLVMLALFFSSVRLKLKGRVGAVDGAVALDLGRGPATTVI